MHQLSVLREADKTIRRGNGLICIHPKTCESVSNDLGLRIDEPKEYLTNNGFPDWCPLPAGTIIKVKA
jgi:hypothetical protein